MKTCIKCGSHAFNLYAEEIDQGGLCDVHYWQGRAHRSEAQPEQEPICNIPSLTTVLAYLERLVSSEVYNGIIDVIEDEFQRKQQPEQEPVALEAVYETIIHWDEGGGKRSRRELARRIVSLYTTPPKRPWVGLTDEDISSVLSNLQVMYNHPPTTDSRAVFAQAIEAKLKEKNT